MTTFRGDVITFRIGSVPRSARRHAGATGHNDAVDTRNALADAVASLDRRAPGFIRFLAGLRWGGLRTVRPDRVTWAAVAVSGTAVGLAGRAAVDRATGSWLPHRFRPPAPLAALAGQVAVFLTVWRWDTSRWRRTRVALVLDLPAQDLVDLEDALRTQGLDVERWERRDRAGGPVAGIVCRSRDLRAVNRAVDAALHGEHEPHRERTA